ncbi:hypothetical protein RM543_05065 [Roseicyclus sp. F158]|uniref:Uncharacterized protein n=1 Tax=Tropicimonas omnivorans TaxID=3075590 RepID=A0ABU3DEB0_9RHOB|nr:hypothetical protein [Roseicyclus sp. F158]MDT0682045.1 hypothetical protein [Roseicyclus sp. F158]
MSEMSGTIEGRLLAQRKVLSMILSHLSGGGNADALMDRLRQESTFEGFEEDPGEGEGNAFAIEESLAEEIRAILRDVDARSDT